jgi:hypothetical protein
MDMDSDGHWLTYEAAALVLGITKSSVRQKAIRGKLRRVHDNTGKALVLVPDTVRDNASDSATDNASDGVSNRVDTPTRTPSVHATLAAAVDELKAQLKAAGERETRLTQLAAAEARAGEESAKTAQAIAAFESLAQRLEAMAAARRLWWRRLVG